MCTEHAHQLNCVTTLTNVLQRASKDMCKIISCKISKTVLSTDSSKNAPWWDYDCVLSKKLMHKILNTYRISRKDTDLIRYLDHKSAYKKLCKSKERNYKVCKLKELERCVTTKDFWNNINSLKCTTDRNIHIRQIEPSRWLNYFKELFSNINHDMRIIEFDLEVTNFLSDHDQYCNE